MNTKLSQLSINQDVAEVVVPCLDLDETLIAYFKLKAGEEGYQSLISEILRQSVSQEELQGCLP